MRGKKYRVLILTYQVVKFSEYETFQMKQVRKSQINIKVLFT